MDRPFLSALIDTYNHEKFIEQAVRSVLEQDYPMEDVEIVVVDDGSTDRTPELLRKFEPRVRVVRKENGGQGSAFNLAIPQCRGEVIAFLDGDDWWKKEKLSVIVPLFQAHPEIGGIGHGILMVNESGELQNTVVPRETSRLNARTPEAAGWFARHGGFFGTSRVAYRKAILEKILPVPERVAIEADEWLYTLAPCLSDVLVLDQPLFYYRVHAGNLFLVRTGNEKGARRLYDSLACLVKNLPAKMRELGVSLEVETALLEHLRLQTERMRLQLDGGSRREVLKVERATSEYFVGRASVGYRAFKLLTLLMAVVLPARQFFRLKQWYAESRLRHTRKWIGDAAPAGPVIERRADGAGEFTSE